MPRQSDNADEPSTLPPPELNPLMNPVLGEHMGRWAEVYFTNPPEKREQAVLELLHELEIEDALRESQPREEPAVSTAAIREQASLPVHFPFKATQPLFVGCPSCGEENFAQQKFCGMCGTPLVEETSATDLQVEPTPQAEPTRPEQNREPLFSKPEHRATEHPADEPVPRPREFSLVRRAREIISRVSDLYRSPESALVWNSYRIYIGATLSILILAVAYIAWRGAEATSETTKESSTGVSDVTAQPSATVMVHPADPTPTSSPRNVEQSLPSAARSAENKASAPSIPPQPTPVAPLPTNAAEKEQQLQAKPGSGSEELAIAQDYLNGTGGKERNTELAVGWLWKAVAKRNADATIRLSDLYLKGDGVQKNCDQARVLLDAAARKGRKDAGERLLHLQSFGCE